MPQGTTAGNLDAAQKISEVMTPEPVVLPLDTSLSEAARIMRDHAIGDVLVSTDGQVCGVVTDRDIVVRALAENRDPAYTVLGDVCSANVITVTPEDDTATAVDLMRRRAVRRLPVVVAGRPVGIVSISDLMIGAGEEPEPAESSTLSLLSVLSEINKAPPSQ